MKDPRQFAEEWIAAWNSHNLERILSHYSDDVEITTPMIQVALGTDTSTLRGKEDVQEYWAAALERVPDLHFRLREVTAGVNSVAVCYESVMEKIAIEVMFFDGYGKVRRVIAHYTE